MKIQVTKESDFEKNEKFRLKFGFSYQFRFRKIRNKIFFFLKIQIFQKKKLKYKIGFEISDLKDSDFQKFQISKN